MGEATALRIKDVDLERRRLEVEVNAVEVGNHIEVGTPKTHTRRSVAFPMTLVPALEQACMGKAADALVFQSRAGGSVRRSKTDAGCFGTAVRRAELPRLTPHDLGHTAASLAISSGANVKAVQRMLGHASASMTPDVYAYLFDEDLDDVAERLDERLKGTAVTEALSHPHESR